MVLHQHRGPDWGARKQRLTVREEGFLAQHIILFFDSPRLAGKIKKTSKGLRDVAAIKSDGRQRVRYIINRCWGETLEHAVQRITRPRKTHLTELKAISTSCSSAWQSQEMGSSMSDTCFGTNLNGIGYHLYRRSLQTITAASKANKRNVSSQPYFILQQRASASSYWGGPSQTGLNRLCFSGSGRKTNRGKAKIARRAKKSDVRCGNPKCKNEVNTEQWLGERGRSRGAGQHQKGLKKGSKSGSLCKCSGLVRNCSRLCAPRFCLRKLWTSDPKESVGYCWQRC